MADRPGGEPTEAPTPRRLSEARRKGEVARSRDLSGAAVFGATLLALVFGAGAWTAGFVVMFRAILGGASAMSPSDGAAVAFDAGLTALLPALAAAFAAAIAVGFMQTRGLFSFESLKPDLGRLSPVAQLKKLFGPEAAVEVGKGLLKVAVAGWVAWLTLRPHLRDIAVLPGSGPAQILGALGVVGKTLWTRLLLATIVLAVLDYLWQRSRHEKNLRMTREEVKREHKESEGDPAHKAERQRLHKRLMEERMVADVRSASFVVVNPDHIAVAIRFDADKDAAPVVVAKGENLLAGRIRDVAREAGVPIFRDVTLARSLRDVEEGDEIPEALYEAVAELIRVLDRAEGAASTDAAPQAPERPGAGWKRV